MPTPGMMHQKRVKRTKLLQQGIGGRESRRPVPLALRGSTAAAAAISCDLCRPLQRPALSGS